MTRIISNPPPAENFYKTLSNMGHYNLPAALADIIDNSITAEANFIEIMCLFNEGDPIITIQDNGKGMDEEELIVALRPAGKDQDEERKENDLGRFGYGLKSATFSQASILNVITSKGTKIYGGKIDQDDCEDYKNTIYDESEIRALFDVKDFNNKPFTKVTWSNLKRLTNNKTITEKQFIEMASDARDELAIIFHRFLVKEGKNNKIDIKFNNISLDIIDPYMKVNNATIKMPMEITKSHSQAIKMTPYILPHYSKLTPIEIKQSSGEEGYIRKQGFYIYRARRLIISGTWFKLAKHGDLTKLARVQVDINNKLDKEFKIPIDKSNAIIDPSLKKRFKDLILKIQEKSVRVYQKKGAKISIAGIDNFWSRKIKDNKILYEIDISHPILKSLLEQLDSEKSNKLKKVLNFIAKDFPKDTLISDMSDDPDRMHFIDTDIKSLIELAKALVELKKEQGKTEIEIIDFLSSTPPFKLHRKYIIEELSNDNTLQPIQGEHNVL